LRIATVALLVALGGAGNQGTQQGFKIGAVQHDVIYVLFAAT
jgi:hypothetical protein